MMVFVGSGPYLLTTQLYKSQRTPSRSTRLPWRCHGWARLMAACSSSEIAGAAST